jgi:hypothetical protein
VDFSYFFSEQPLAIISELNYISDATRKLIWILTFYLKSPNLPRNIRVIATSQRTRNSVHRFMGRLTQAANRLPLLPALDPHPEMFKIINRSF